MAGKGQRPHVGRCATREDLIRLVVDLFRETEWSQAKIAKFCGVSADVVYAILQKEGW